MTRRILGIEVRRSAVLWIGLLTCAAGWVMLSDPERWTGRWMALVSGHRNGLFLLCPLVAAAGAWQAGRDRAARMTDLLGSTPRSRRSRVAPLATALAGCVAVAYPLSLVEPLSRTVPTASYQPPGWVWPVLVGALAVLAAGLVGLGVGRLLPSRLTAPVLVVTGVVTIVVPQILAGGTGSPVLLLLPDLADADEFATVHWRTNLGQAIWFAGLAAGGFVLLAAERRAVARAGIVVLLSLALAWPVLPRADRATPVDPGATSLVCAPGAPRVCVRRVYEPVLGQLVQPARRALATLGRLPNAPTAVIQETQHFGHPLAQRRDTVHLALTVDVDGQLVTGPESLEASILDGAGTWSCGGTDDASRDRVQAARAVAGGWLQDRSGPPVEHWPTPIPALITSAWRALRALPAAEQVDRVAALREAALRCQDDLYAILTAP